MQTHKIKMVLKPFASKAFEPSDASLQGDYKPSKEII
jgi:hypothetical protein